MKQLIKIFVVLLLFWLFAQSLGLFLNDKLKLNFKKYYFFIGIIAIFGVYGILMIFPLLYNLSSIYSYIAGFITLLICVYSLFIERKQLITNIKDKKQFHVILLISLTIVLFFISGNAVNDFNDTYYYESFIAENTKAATLNYINLFQSGYTYISHLHGYDSYYHFLALLSNVFRINPYLLITWLMPFIYSLFYFSTYAEIIEHFRFNFNKKILFIPLYFLIFAGLFDYFDLAYVGNFYNPPIMSIIILLLSKNDLSLKQSIFVMLCFFTGIFTQSTFIIYSIVIIVAKAFHIFINKDNKQITNICIYSYPVLFFSLLTFTKSFNIFQSSNLTDFIIAIVSLFIVIFFNKILDIKKIKFLCIIFSLLIYISSIVLIIINQYKYGPQDFLSTLDPYNQGLNYLMIVVDLIPIIIISFNSIRNRNYNFLFILILITILIFFNPLTISTISTYMTDVVYIRIFNLCTSFVIILYSISLINNIYSLLLILLITISQIPSNKISIYNKDTDYLLYRMSYDSYNAFIKLDELTRQYKEKTGVPPSTFATDLRSEFITNDAGYIYNLTLGRKILTGDRTKYNSFKEEQIGDLYAALTKGDNFKNPGYISNVISNQVIKFLLINTNQTSKAITEIEKTCSLSYENDSYYLYTCNQ